MKSFLESLGYDVRAEVKDCDITAARGDELIVAELKTVSRSSYSSRRPGVSRWPTASTSGAAAQGWLYRARHCADIVRLCRRLKIGLLWVGFTSEGVGHVDAAVHPARAPPRNSRRRFAVLTEHSRSGTHNTGGATRRKILTAHKERCLAVAQLVGEHGQTTGQW